jgi:hypothetical protein
VAVPTRVIVALSGGLGNQLFQISHAMSSFPKSELLFEYGFSSKSTEEVLSKLKFKEVELLVVNTKFPKIIKKLSNFEIRELSKVASKIRRNTTTKLLEFYLSKKYKVRKIRIYTESKVLNRNKEYTFLQIGYFQKYDHDCLRVLDLLPRESVPEYDTWRSEAVKFTPLVCHVRLGDYKIDSKIGLLPTQYFQKALLFAWKQSSCSTIWLFSDEPELAVNIIPAELVSYVRVIPKEYDSVETLCLMTLGNHFVISNSTFSWWGALLAPNRGKTVYYPAPWFSMLPEPESLIPNGWIPIDSQLKKKGG